MDGVSFDPLTEDFLQIASDRELGLDVGASLREFFHDARNRLCHLKLSLYLAKQGAEGVEEGVWNELDQSYQGLKSLVDRVATICGPSRSAPVSGQLGSWLEERRATWTAWLESRGRRLEWAPPPREASGRFDPKRLIEGLDALIGWRAYAGRRGEPARLAWGVEGGELWIVWSEPETCVDDWVEGRESRAVSMAVPLLGRVLSDHAGVLVVSLVDGLIVRMTWPAGAGFDRPT